MDEDLFRVRFWGVRGSVPVSGPQFIRYGGNTACIEMRCGPHTLFFDAGSGIRPAGDALKAAGINDFDVFFTHCHYDHIIGLPFFYPFYDPKTQVRLWSGHLAGRMTTREMVSEFMRPPWFPVKLEICEANLDTVILSRATCFGRVRASSSEPPASTIPAAASATGSNGAGEPWR